MSQGDQLLSNTFDHVLSADYRDAYDCANALAAGQVVAILNGRPAVSLPESVADWIQAHPGFLSPQLIANARQAVQLILDESELQELWAESDTFAEWQTEVLALINSLQH